MYCYLRYLKYNFYKTTGLIVALGFAFPFYQILTNRNIQQPHPIENRENEPLRIEEVPKTTHRAIKPKKSSKKPLKVLPAAKPNEDSMEKLKPRKISKMAPKSLLAAKPSEESFEDLNAGGDFDFCDSNSASNIDNEEIASIDESEGNKVKILPSIPSIIDTDGKQCDKINNKTYLLTELKLKNDES